MALIRFLLHPPHVPDQIQQSNLDHRVQRLGTPGIVEKYPDTCHSGRIFDLQIPCYSKYLTCCEQSATEDRATSVSKLYFKANEEENPTVHVAFQGIFAHTVVALVACEVERMFGISIIWPRNLLCFQEWIFQGIFDIIACHIFVYKPVLYCLLDFFIIPL